MKWFRDLEIFKKLMLLVLLMTVFLVIVGYIGYYFNNKAAKDMNSLYYDRALPVEWLNRINILSLKNRVLLLKAMLNSTENNQAKINEYIKNIRKNNEIVDELFFKYEKTNLLPFEIENLKIAKKQHKIAREIRERGFKLLQSGRMKEAYNLFPLIENNYNQYLNIIETLIEYNVKVADEINAQNNKNADYAKTAILFSIILGTLLSLLTGLLIAKAISDPLVHLLRNIQKVAEGNFLGDMLEIKSRDEIGRLIAALNIMIANLKTLMNREVSLRQIISRLKDFSTHNEIYNYLLEELLNIFNMPGINRALHFHYDKAGDLYVYNEAIKGLAGVNPMLGQTIPHSAGIQELHPESSMHIITVNDAEKEIQNPKLKYYLTTNNIGAFMVYATFGMLPEERENKILGLTMLCSVTPRTWLQNEKDYYRIVVDTVSLSYLEMRQKQEVENIKQTFLATLTHDLRSPLNAEQKALEAILSEKLGTSLCDFSEYLCDIYKTNEELLRIVNNILAVYHYESGQVELRIELIKIGDVIGDSVRSMSHLAKDQGSEITTQIQPELPLVNVDKDEIYRVITNLLSNAIKHNKKGTNIIISANKTDNAVQVSVQDNGKGISEVEKPNIFERYPTAKRKIGTGLGLYLSKQIIDAHKGKIWFETEEGKGTIFYFSIPI